MSGICGVWSMCGRPPDIEQVLARLVRRGPDRMGTWTGGQIVLGHTLLATTPEAIVEILPLTHSKSGCTITADVRLDNRDDLISKLGLRRAPAAIGDGELILQAYLEWGDECPTHLLGDFAFVIWDSRTERIFGARDHMGMRQLLYHHCPGRLFAFATEADALVAHPDVPRQINQGRIADYLDDLEGIDFSSTFFDEVYRLPPAHTLTVDHEGLAVRQYWELTAGTELKLGTNREYADALLKVFIEAVQSRLRTARPVGAMLSGGLDSNSIAAVAGAQMAAAGLPPLQTFSALEPETTHCPESDAIRLAVQSPLFSPTLIRRDQTDEWVPDVLPMTEACAEPFDAYLVISKAIYASARRSNINVVLDGVSADVIFTAGNRVAGLLRTGQIAAAAKEARLEARFWGPTYPAGKIFVAAAWATFAPLWARRFRRHVGWWLTDAQMNKGHENASSELAAAVKLKDRRTRFRRNLPRSRPFNSAYRVDSVRHPHLVVARERYDRVAAAFGIEPRDPFMDIRVIQLALSMPPSQMQSDGWPKSVLRRAMENILPREIAWRRRKSHVGWAFMTALLPEWGPNPPDRTAITLVEPLVGRRLRSEIGSTEKSPGWLKLFILSHWLYRKPDRRP